MGKTLDPWFVDILVCPESKAPVIQVGDFLYSTDRRTRRRYAIKDGIPNMLIEESTVISEEEFSSIMQKHGRKT